ncbi:hypothetical protein N865_08575 [Intrasporangium oryzae NRRL B-24470]|uniref:Uncharacterized protein n=1 Tax=Intrasporangium oryzae NRRL B-24470 TaxID=1386089 RepID=W9G5E4_9MICO|nr:hypothetical protein [Intrasporangium oryzae]EWT01391.1 hypothetical protein N865_08575 [Intrasporangium oryzae NRRL B-24470]
MPRYRQIIIATLFLSVTACAGPPTSPEVSRTPSHASSSASKAASCSNPGGGDCLGDLAAGTYGTRQFRPGFSYTVPPGWRNDEDLPGNFFLYRSNDPQSGVVGGSYLGIYQNVRAAAIDCSEAAQPGVGITPGQLIVWYQTIPGLVVSSPKSVTVGGLSGFQIDLALKPGTRACSFEGHPGIPLVIGNGVSELHHVILHELDVRLIILDWKNGNVVLEITSVKDRVSSEEYRATVQPIVDSLQFEVT